MDYVHLDGRTLEGGGQLVRNAIAISSLTKIPIHITHIRGGRGSNGKDGGLKPAHLAAIQWLAQSTAANTQGLELKSRELKFQPTTNQLESIHHSKLWIPRYLDDQLVRLESTVSLDSPGSITLILQAILPLILFGGMKVPLWLTIKGGTNVSSSPSIDYFIHVFFPVLSKTLGITPIQHLMAALLRETTINKRGWTIGRLEVGSVTFKILPAEPSLNLVPFNVGPRGELKRVHCHIISDGVMRHEVEKVLHERLRRIVGSTIEVISEWENSFHKRRLYVLLVAEWSDASRIASDCLHDIHTRAGKADKRYNSPAGEFADRIDEAVAKVVDGLKQELEVEDSCLDQHLQDQLVIYQALVKGRATIHANPEPTLHTKTARWVAHTVLGLDFDESGECDGIALKDVEVVDGKEQTGSMPLEQLKIH